MKALSFLKIGHKFLLFTTIISSICILGMLSLNQNATLIQQEINEIHTINLKNCRYLYQAEKHVNNIHLNISQTKSLLSVLNNSQIALKIAAAEENLNLANAQFKLYKQNLSNNEKYLLKNHNSLFKVYNKYYDITKSLATQISSSDSAKLVRGFYLNNYTSAYNNLKIAFKNFEEESYQIISSKLNNISDKSSKKNLTLKTKNLSFLYFLLIIILLISSGIFLARNISKPLNIITKYIRRLSYGELPDDMVVESKDEIGEIKTVINSFVLGLKKTANFSKQIGEGSLNVDFEPLSDKDILGNALLEMRKGLKEAKNEESRRKIEDDKRNWTTQGLAKFGDILRKDNDNLDKLSNDIISNLIEYINANQGGLFLINDDDDENIFIELIASYAFSRKKFQEKKIQIGEGLVGTCMVEKSTIYITEVPDDYIEITSGLGDSNPRSVLIVPLKIDDKIFGVIEIASFNKFENYQIDFVEKIGESIASTLSSVKINARTAALLDETRLQAEEMATKEEEMRQNLEELKATQEEMERIKQREVEKNEDVMKSVEEQRKMLIKILDQIPEKVSLKDKDGKIVLVNNAVAEAFNMPTEKIIGQTDYDLFDPDKAKEIHAEEIEIMNTGEKSFEEIIDENGKKKIVFTKKMPFYIPFLKHTGLLGVQSDITKLKELEERETQLRAEINKLKKNMNPEQDNIDVDKKSEAEQINKEENKKDK